jgi:integrase
MSKRRRQAYIGCSIGERAGRLRLRFRWQGKPHSIATGLADTPENRRALWLLAKKVGAVIKAGENPTTVLMKAMMRCPPAPADAAPCPRLGPTVAEYAHGWIAQQTPPLVRKAQARDYRRHVLRYVVPTLGSLSLVDVKPSDLRGVQAELFARGLSVRYVKNILAGSFRAMIRQATADGLVTQDPFAGLKWPKATTPEPDPFTADERTRILRWFAEREFSFNAGGATAGPRRRPHPPYHAFISVLFWTGMRPSEAAGLQWQDLDLDRGRLHVRRSRHLWEYGAPKTDAARRTVELFPQAVRLLLSIQPLRVTPEMPVFTNTVGKAIEPNSLLPHWYACQRALGIRVRGLYCTKDTYVTTALTVGAKIAWLEQQTGVAYATLRRHYGKWIPTEGESELSRFAALDPGLFRGQIVSAKQGRADTILVSGRGSSGREMRKGGLEPPRVVSPQDPESCASANSATFARGAFIAVTDG